MSDTIIEFFNYINHPLYKINIVPSGTLVDCVTRIYALKDEHGRTRYVGKTIVDLAARLRGHFKNSKKPRCHANYWIRSLLDRGVKPSIALLEVIPPFGEWWIAESDWIERHLLYGCNLTNEAAGGNGPGRFSTESREKLANSISAVHEICRTQGRPYTDKPPTEESKKKNARAHIESQIRRETLGIVHPRTVNRRLREQLEGRSPAKTTAWREAKKAGIVLEKKPRAKEQKKREPFTVEHRENLSMSVTAMNAARREAGITHPRTINRREKERLEGRLPTPGTAYREALVLRKLQHSIKK